MCLINGGEYSLNYFVKLPYCKGSRGSCQFDIEVTETRIS